MSTKTAPIDAEFYLRNMTDHRLTVISQTDRVQCFRCGRPDTGTFSFYVTFTPAGICIQGDITPERNGSVSCRGYGVGWFAGGLSPGYLSEKFLTQKYTSERAKRELADPWFREGKSPEVCCRLDELIDQVDDHGNYGSAWLYEECVELGIDVSDGCPGWGYCPNEQAVLSAIQRKFAELYQAQNSAVQQQAAEMYRAEAPKARTA